MLDPIEFKAAWLAKKTENWIEFSESELRKAPLEQTTFSFLTHGFPRSAAPFLGFGWLSYEGKFYTIASYYENLDLDNSAQNHWIIGSDGAGNPICIDTMRQDRIVLLDHEESFEISCVMNNNIQELAACLVCYRDFVDKVIEDNGEDAFIEMNFSEHHLKGLKESFQAISPDVLDIGNYWRSVLYSLR